jgi:uncharacterized protein YyaL (SSP411 family)
LQHASSPYLRQHADNPVDWFEWGSEALAKAKRENKPIIISIGYSSCHWCHVMEEESFMDTAVARLMNDHFVSIKIDREERPDIDQIYLHAAQLISGNGGWPLNAFALPDGKPFYAATYFPKEQWIRLLDQMSESYKNDYAKIVRQANALTKGIQSNEVDVVVGNDQQLVDMQLYTDIREEWEPYLDYQHGGLKGAPKFPLPSLWEFYLQQYDITGNKNALEIVTVTLDNLYKGGIYDHLAGGFARYTTDSTWRVPHFEKMLYDNAQLVSLYAHAFQVTGNPTYEKVIHETLAFIDAELTSAEGGFYSSVNADSEGEEGKFYVWQRDEVVNALSPEDAEMIIDLYQITENGNWGQGKNILYRKHTNNQLADGKEVSSEDLKAKIENAERTLLDLRNQRTRPSVDTKILSSWNALMLKGYIDAFFATGTEAYLQSALKDARFLQQNMMSQDGHLYRIYTDGRASTDAFLDDYALVARAMIQLYQATFDKQWLESAKSIADFALENFDDETSSMFYYTQHNNEELVARKKEVWDNVIPSSNAVFAEVLFLLGEYYADAAYKETAIAMVNTITPKLGPTGPYYAYWASLVGLITHQPYEVAVVGDAAIVKSHAMLKVYNPTAIYMGGTTENLPLLKNKLVKGRTIIYVCRQRICRSPETDVQKALALIN